MDAIADYYATQIGVLAVAAFGSNAERKRFDDSSDLDFLVFVEPDAKTGEILALVNAPSYDPNNPGVADSDSRRNRAPRA